jgi:DNA-binding CsgD family transcriptional regulator
VSILHDFATWDRGVDVVAVQRVLNGSLPHTVLEPEELRYAARLATGSARSVAKLLGVTEKTVINWRGAEQ